VYATNDAVFTNGTPAAPADDRRAITEAIAAGIVANLKAKYHAEFLPALKRTARAYFAYVVEAVHAGAIYAQFDGYGMNIPAPETLVLRDADVPALALALVDAGLLDVNDVILADLPDLKPTGA
jgi:hypothetical protein